MTTSIVLVDDRIVREGLRKILAEHGDLRVVGEATDGEEAVDLVNAAEPDVAIFEITLPRLSGIDAIRKLKASRSATHCMVLSNQQSRRFVRAALRAGASGYVVKAASPGDLLDAIECVRQGKTYLSPDIAQLAVEAMAADSEGGPSVRSVLTPREQEVLEHICDGSSTREIAGLLGITVKTVDHYRSELMSKFGIHKVSSLVRFAIREGFVSA
jgi:DNA-binding NarL/FixJ family response regulator